MISIYSFADEPKVVVNGRFGIASDMERISFGAAAIGQVAAVIAVIGAIAVWPPRHGAMLMIPLSGRAAVVVDVAVTADAGLLAMGPLPGSMIVIGNRAALAGPALAHGVVLLAAPRAMCGAPVKGIA